MLHVKLTTIKTLKLSCRPLDFTWYKAFLKNSLPVLFSAWFLKKNIYVIFCYLTKFRCLVAFTLWDIGQYVYWLCFLTRLWRHKFWDNLIFRIKPFFLHGKKYNTNVLNIFRTNRAFKMKEKAFFTIFKELSLKQIKQFFGK